MAYGPTWTEKNTAVCHYVARQDRAGFSTRKNGRKQMGMENQNNLIMQPCATLDCENLVPMPGSDFARFFPTMKILCESCDIERIEELKRKQAKEEQERRQEAFFSLCPPIYRESDLNRIPAVFLRECRTWKVTPQGLAFVGKAGSGKTRASWLLLKRLHFSGVGVYGLTATQYAKACADQWQDNAQLTINFQN